MTRKNPISRDRDDEKPTDWKEDGAANRTRTCDPVITNDVLYQLSYCGGPLRSVFMRHREVWPETGRFARKRPHLISGSASLGKKNAGAQSPCGGGRAARLSPSPCLGAMFSNQPRMRERKPRHPPDWPGAGNSANSSGSVPSSTPGSSGGRIIGMTGGIAG